MLRSPLARSIFPALALALCLAFASPVHAEDETKENSAAAQLFRDAWWAETGAGALDTAAEGYRKAIAAEGSEAIRGRALYRLALVLQRMGRVEEGVRSLERLAKEFPKETLLLTKARARLDEWTAEDLRESFGDWYRRYQYSPEFQAKIVDLVLKLGTPGGVSQAARNELLTIGEPAIAALEQHAGSANSTMSRMVNQTLISLGRVPPPATMFASTGWSSSTAFWTLVKNADEPTRAALAAAAAANPKGDRAARIHAMLAGPDGVLALMRSTKQGSERLVYTLLDPWLLESPDPALANKLRAMVTDPAVEGGLRAVLAGRLVDGRTAGFSDTAAHPLGVTETDLVAWSHSEVREVRKVVWGIMRLATVSSPEALAAVIDAIQDKEQTRTDLKEKSGALFGLLRRMPADADLEAAVEAVVTLLEATSFKSLDTYPLQGRGEGRRGSPDVPMDVLARAIGRAKGKALRSAPKDWFYRTAQGEAAVEQLLVWAEGAVDENIQYESLLLAAWHATGDMLRLTAPLVGETDRNRLGKAVFDGLKRNDHAARLGWDEESLLRLVEAADARYGRAGGSYSKSHPAGGRSIPVRTRYGTSYSEALFTLLHDREVGETFRRAVAAHPERASAHLWTLLGEGWTKVERNRQRGLAMVSDGWSQWAPTQRKAGLDTLLDTHLVTRGDKDLDVLLRKFLAAKDNPPEVRTHLLEWLAKLSLDDVRGAFDLSTEGDVDAAASLLRKLPRTQAVYDAFLPALRPEGEEYGEMYRAFDVDEAPASVVTDLIARLLAHGDPRANEHATDMLTRRGLASDLPQWIGALSHPRSAVRALAAKRLGRLYNKAAIKALAKTVDDADPEVRDAALASLERIEKTEKQKDHWRKFAEDK